MTYEEKVDQTIDALIEASAHNCCGDRAVEVHAAMSFLAIAIVANIEPEQQIAVLDQLAATFATFKKRLPLVMDNVH